MYLIHVNSWNRSNFVPDRLKLAFPISQCISAQVQTCRKGASPALCKRGHDQDLCEIEMDPCAPKIDSTPPSSPVRLDFHETLQGVSAGEYLQVYREFFRYPLSE